MFFARTIDQIDPVYIDEVAAPAASYASLPVPPTFLFSLEMEKLKPSTSVARPLCGGGMTI